MSDKAHALSILAKSAPSADLPRLQHAAVTQLAKIRGLESEAAIRAIVTGIAFQWIKLKIGHGKWEPWLKANVQELGLRQCRYYMKLGVVFMAKMRTQAAELAAVSSDGGELTVHGGHALAKQVNSFVGDLSLSELLEKHKIKKRAAGDDEDDDSDTGSGAGEQMMFAEMSEHLFGLRETILKPENLMKLEPKQLDALKREIEATRTEFLKLYEKARGKRR